MNKSSSRARGRLAGAAALRRIGAAVRKTRPPESGADDAAPAEYLYVPCARVRYHGLSAETRRWVQEVPIVRKTAKRIYYTSDSWDRIEAVVSPGCISREEFETDTRCRAASPRDSAAGPVRAPHGRGPRHCVPNRCRHGYPAGVIPIPGAHPGRRAGYSSPPARPPNTTCTAGNTSEPGRPYRTHHASRSCAARWPTLTPTVAARLSSSSKRATGTRPRSSPPERNVRPRVAPARSR